jgi:hypothetical protein
MLVYKRQGDVRSVSCVNKDFSEDEVVHHLLVDKCQGDFSGPSFVFSKMLLEMDLCSICLYVSARAISVDRPACS